MKFWIVLITILSAGAFGKSQAIPDSLISMSDYKSKIYPDIAKFVSDMNANTRGVDSANASKAHKDLRSGIDSAKTMASTAMQTISLNGLFLSISGTGSSVMLPTIAGPQGIQGTPGKDGKDGINGTNGTNGTDATVTQANIAAAYGGVNPMLQSDSPKFKSASYTAIQSETDPIWIGEKVNYYTKTTSDAKYYPITNPSAYISNIPPQPWSSITGKPIQDYVNKVGTTGTTGNAVFYLTSDKTASGTALFTVDPLVFPIVNDATQNYTYGWTLSGDKKTLTVNVKSSAGINVSLVSLTLLGAPVNVPAGTQVQILVKPNQ